MSQAKVDRYKQEKKNREKIAKKKKIKRMLLVFMCSCIVGIGIGYPLGKYLYKRNVKIREEKATISADSYDLWMQNNWNENHLGVTGLDFYNEEQYDDIATDTDADITASPSDVSE